VLEIDSCFTISIVARVSIFQFVGSGLVLSNVGMKPFVRHLLACLKMKMFFFNLLPKLISPRRHNELF